MNHHHHHHQQQHATPTSDLVQHHGEGDRSWGLTILSNMSSYGDQVSYLEQVIYLNFGFSSVNGNDKNIYLKGGTM